MRIVIVTENFLPKIDGVTRTIVKLLDRIQDEGHDVILLGPSGYDGDYGRCKVFGTYGIPFWGYPELKFNFFQLALIRRLIEFQPHIIHFVDPAFFGPQMMLACHIFLPRVPRISSYHTNIALYFRYFGLPQMSSTVWFIQAFLHSRCQRTLCPSTSTKRTLVEHKFDPSKLVVWRGGVDLASFSPSYRDAKTRGIWLGEECHHFDEVLDEGISLQDSQRTIILYVGRVSWEKNLRVLVEAYRQLDHCQCHLVIVGDGPAKEDTEKILAGLPVTFTGYLEGDDLSRAFASGDIFAFPSKSETFGQVNIEAAASGLPVVGFVAEGIRDIVQHGRTGLLINPSQFDDDSKDIAVTRSYRDALQSLILDPQLRERMGREASAAASAYSWKESMDLCIRTYHEFESVENSAVEGQK